ncbi:hypothetical protein [Paenibacillus sp. GCM10028914]
MNTTTFYVINAITGDFDGMLVCYVVDPEGILIEICSGNEDGSR